MAGERWQIGSGESGNQWLLGDGLGEEPKTWDPVQGEQKQVPHNLPSKPQQAYEIGYKQGQVDATPKSFGEAVNFELNLAAMDTGTMIGGALRKEWVEAVGSFLYPEEQDEDKSESNEQKGPSKARQAAGAVGRAGKWAARTGINMAANWAANRRTRAEETQDATNHPELGDGIVDGEWREVK